MSYFNVHSGDFSTGGGEYNKWSHTFLLHGEKNQWTREKIPASNVVSIEVVTEENKSRTGARVGLGAVGAIAFGPLGLLAAAVPKKKDNITFIAKCKDGRKLMATADRDAFLTIRAAAL